MATTRGPSSVEVKTAYGVIIHAFGKNNASTATSSEILPSVSSYEIRDNKAMFRASTDGEQAFGEKTNLSNRTASEYICLKSLINLLTDINNECIGSFLC